MVQAPEASVAQALELAQALALVRAPALAEPGRAARIPTRRPL